MGQMMRRLALRRRGVLLCLLGLLSSCGSRSQNAFESPFKLVQVGPNVWAAISNQESKTPTWANVGFVIGDDSVAVIDTTNSSEADGNFDAEPARLLLAAIRNLTKLP